MENDFLKCVGTLGNERVPHKISVSANVKRSACLDTFSVNLVSILLQH